jgi:hypothetical protein
MDERAEIHSICTRASEFSFRRLAGLVKVASRELKNKTFADSFQFRNSICYGFTVELQQ